MAEDLIVTSYYASLEAQKWWQFKDASSQESVRVACTRPTNNRLELTIKSSKLNSQHFLSVEGDEFWGQRLTWLESRDQQLGTIKWSNGLHLPYGWKIGEAVSATSEAPVGGLGHAALTLTLKGFTELKVPSWSPLPQTNGVFTPFDPDSELNKEQVIEVKQAMRIQELGTVVSSGSVFLAYGIGVVKASINNFGVFVVLDLEDWGPR